MTSGKRPPILGYRSPGASKEHRQPNTAGLTSVVCAILAISAIVSEIVNATLVGSEIVDVVSWLICPPAILVGCISGVVAAHSWKSDNRIAQAGLLINLVLAALVAVFIYYSISNAY
jgi:hypothetical protein